MKRNSSAAAGGLVVRGQRHRRPAAPGRAGRDRRAVTSRPAARSPGTAKRTAEREPVAALGLLERGGVALEDPLLLLGYAESPEQSRAPRRPSSTADGPEAPGLAAHLVVGRRATGQRVVGTGDDEHLVDQERLLHEPIGRGARRRDRSPRRRCGRRAARGSCATGCTLSSTSRSAARLVNRSIRPGAACSAKRLEVATRSTRRPCAGLADLADGAVLEAEDLHRPAGQPQPARGERQPGRRSG